MSEEKQREKLEPSAFDAGVLLQSAQTPIFWKDAARRFAGANRAFLDYFGFADEKEILGKTDEEMGWHSNPEPYRADELAVLREGVSTSSVPGTCVGERTGAANCSQQKPCPQKRKDYRPDWML
jgi:PAS domain-containing protein